MKQIKILDMHLVNFKGVREIEIKFNDDITSISGRNGSGKTTIIDAFTWLLFGKDSKDRKQFNIKTLDENGVPIPQLPHEVSATLLVDGKEVRLCRRYTEIWRRRQGSAQTEFDGHQEERIYDDAPLSVRDWNDRINGIVDESVFKYITTPSYFPTRKIEQQREMLFDMAGRISDEDIAKGNSDFENLMKALDGRPMDEYKTSISAKKRRLKEEAIGIPSRIDERKRSMPDDEDWAQLESDLENYNKQIAEIDKMISDGTMANRQADKYRRQLSDNISKLETEKIRRKAEIENEVSKSYYDALQKQNEHKSNIRILETECATIKSNIERLNISITGCNGRRNELIREWNEIKMRSLQFSDDQFCCPTCGRMLEYDDIEAKKGEMMANFNAKKAADIEQNRKNGQENKARLEGLSDNLKCEKKRLEELEAKISEMHSVSFDIPQEPDATEAIANDSKMKDLDRQISESRRELDTYEPPQTGTDELQRKREEIGIEITDIKLRLSKKDDIAKDKERIAELESQLRNLNSEIAALEGIEMTMLDFSKAKAAYIEEKVNGMFHLVKFRMFDTLINGAEVETCVATVNGVPYNDGLNTAMQINAGIDIINAICNHVGVRAPIYIDNAESVNQLIKTDSQVIRLVVSEDKQIKVS